MNTFRNTYRVSFTSQASNVFEVKTYSVRLLTHDGARVNRDYENEEHIYSLRRFTEEEVDD